MDQFLVKLNGLGAQLNPLAKNIERGFGQVKQYASEKLGTAEEITELPQEYVALERKVDSIRELLVSLQKTFGGESIVPTVVQDAVSDLTKSIRVGVSTSFPTLGTGDVAEESAETTNAHLTAKACRTCAEALGEQDPFGVAMKKFSAVESKVGDADVLLGKEKLNKFVKPIQHITQERMSNVARARRNVINTRLHLDSIKSRFKSAAPPKLEEIQVELEKAEDVFVDSVEEAIKLMKDLVQSPEILRHISNLIALQLAYYKQCTELFTELAPEIDELQVTQEALYNSKFA